MFFIFKIKQLLFYKSQALCWSFLDFFFVIQKWSFGFKFGIQTYSVYCVQKYTLESLHLFRWSHFSPTFRKPNFLKLRNKIHLVILKKSFFLFFTSFNFPNFLRKNCFFAMYLSFPETFEDKFQVLPKIKSLSADFRAFLGFLGLFP